MRLIYLSSFRLPTKRAHGLQIMKMCENFAAVGVEVTLLIPWRFNLVKEDPFVFYNVGRSFKIVKVPALDLYPLRFVSEKISVAVLLLTFFISAKVYLWCHKFDQIYTREIFFGLFAKDFTFGAHNFPSRVSWLHRFIFGRIKYFVALNSYLKDSFIQQGVPAEKIIVLPDAVSKDFFAGVPAKANCRTILSLPLDKKIILYSGSFFPWKGVDTLAEAVKMLPDNLFFVFVGGIKESNIERIKNIVGNRGNVKIIDYLPHKKIPLYLSAADILILPNSAERGISSYYTSPLKLFEYLTTGRPIVASDLPSLREILSELNCVFFEPDNPASLAAAIRKVLADPRLAEKMARQALQDSRKYAWDDRAYEILKLITKIKICYLANIRLITTKAHSWQILKTCEALAAQGVAIELVVPKAAAVPDPFKHYQLERSFKITYIRTPLLLAWGWWGFWVRSMAFSVSALGLVLRQPKEMIIYSRDELLIWLIGLSGRRAVWEMHTARFNWLTRQAGRTCFRLILISKSLKDFFVRRNIMTWKCLVAPDGVDIISFDRVPNDEMALRRDLSLPLDKKIACHAGRYRTMGVSKGVDNLFRWWPKVLVVRPDAFLLIIGLSPEEKVLVKNLAESFDLPKNSFGLFGYVSHEEVIKFIKASDALVMNYPAMDHYLNFMSPLKLFEYMASRVPMAVPDLPSLREIVDERSAFFFQPDDETSFVAAINQILNLPKERTRRSTAAYQLVQNFSWTRRAQRIIDFIKR